MIGERKLKEGHSTKLSATVKLRFYIFSANEPAHPCQSGIGTDPEWCKIESTLLVSLYPNIPKKTFGTSAELPRDLPPSTYGRSAEGFAKL